MALYVYHGMGVEYILVFSVKPAAISKYYRTAEYRSMYLRQLRDTRGLSDSRQNHPDLQTPRILNDESDIQSLVDLTDTSWMNPPRPEQDDLVSLSSSTLATSDVVNYLLRAHSVGKSADNRLQTVHLEKEPPTLKFHDKMKEQNFKTFSNLNRKKGQFQISSERGCSQGR